MIQYSIGWKESNKKKKWFNRECPEWLWTGIFLAFIIGLVVISSNFDQIEPGEAITAKDEQIVVQDAKTPVDAKMTATGVASWYDYDLNGIEWSISHDTCASRDFKRYGMVRVTNIDNGKSVECYVNDFGPELGQTPERHIDLSSHAFKQISDLGIGLINVKIEEL